MPPHRSFRRHSVDGRQIRRRDAARSRGVRAGGIRVCLGFIVVVFGIALRLCGFRLSRVIGYFKEEILFVFAATSSEAMIPRCMEKLEQLGCSKEVVGLVMPAGFSFNMDGAAIYMAMAVLFIAHATNIDLSWSQQLVMLFVMLFTSKGVVGVTGGGFVALAATIPAVGILPVGGLTLLLGVDRFMSEIRAVTNLFSNIFATVVVAKWMNELDEVRAKSVLDREPSIEQADEGTFVRKAGE